MEPVERFWTAVKEDMTMTLATAAGGRVTMRAVSPVPYEGAVLIFTCHASLKYAQLQENPRCCLLVGDVYAEADAVFPGATMLPENAALRAAYCEKFPQAFDEGVAFGGREASFVLLRPRRLTGWDAPDNAPPAPFECRLG